MTFEKIAVSIPSHLVAKARRAVKDRLSPSVSAYIANAVEEKTERDDLEALLDEMFAETGGPPTHAERTWARKQLGLPSLRRAKRGRAPR